MQANSAPVLRPAIIMRDDESIGHLSGFEQTLCELRHQTASGALLARSEEINLAKRPYWQLDFQALRQKMAGLFRAGQFMGF